MPDGDHATPEPPERTSLVVEIVVPVSRAAAHEVAARVADRLALPVDRMLRLIDGRIGPVTRPLRPERAATVVRIFESEGVIVAARPPRLRASVDVAPAGGAEPLITESAVGSVDVREAARSERGPTDEYIAAVLAGMLAVALCDGPATEAELRAMHVALESMTGSDVGRDVITVLARSRGAGDLAHACEIVAALTESLPEDGAADVVGMFFLAGAAGGWGNETVRAVAALARALRLSPEDVRDLFEQERVG